MRNLCSIQTIKTIEDIPGKDKIGLASFVNTGWHVIVGKSDFKAGDLCVYVEYDTLLPEKPEFEFLRKRCWNEKWKGFRITAMKMAGVVSEGIVFPISILHPITRAYGEVKDGLDVTEAIGAKKYDPELLEEKESVNQMKKWYSIFMRIPLFKKWFFPKKESGSWPSFLPGKTDETRIQVLQYVIEDWREHSIEVTEKLDGQSVTYSLHKGKFNVFSRNVWHKNKCNNNYWEMAEKYGIEKSLRLMHKKMGYHKNDTIVIQGEIVGPGIQKNKYGLKGKELFIFNLAARLKEKSKWEYSGHFNLSNVLAVYFKMKPVPLVIGGKEFAFNSIDELVEYSRGVSKLNFEVQREGIVVRLTELEEPGKGMSNMSSFKVINPDYIV
jgi:hypothetical protein